MLTIAATVSAGSPPRMRGKQSVYHGIYHQLGITPADAGKTPFAQCYYSTHQDHPRRCGENRFVYRLVVHSSGSPPQVRGKHSSRVRSTVSYRITPAGAGKTSKPIALPLHMWDHPRRCGENMKQPSFMFYGLGSPPQVRGKH